MLSQNYFSDLLDLTLSYIKMGSAINSITPSNLFSISGSSIPSMLENTMISVTTEIIIKHIAAFLFIASPRKDILFMEGSH